MPRKRKRRYVVSRKAALARSPRADEGLVRDQASGVLVSLMGGDLGSNAESRRVRGEITVADRQLTEGGVLLCQGASVTAQTQLDAILLETPPEARERLVEAARRIRDIADQARLRRRTTGLYQASQDRGTAEMSDRQAAALEAIGTLGVMVQWTRMNALLDAVAFQVRLSERQQGLALEGLEILAVHWKL